MRAGLECSSSMFHTWFAEADRKLFSTDSLNSVCLLQVTSDNYKPISSSINGSGFRPFDMVIPFSFRKGEITGEEE